MVDICIQQAVAFLRVWDVNCPSVVDSMAAAFFTC
jgi:hypothetical protein